MDMRFKGKRVIKVPRYKIIIFGFICLGVGVILLNFGISWILSHGSSTFLNVLAGNSFGNTIDQYNIYNNKKLYFYKNSFGIYTGNKSKTTFKSVTNPLVYIYNSYQNAQYKNNYTNLYNVPPVAAQSSLILQEYLEDNGVLSVVELNKIDNDAAVFIKRAKDRYSSLKYFIDIQIVNLSNEETTCVINDKRYAKLFFKVGKEYRNLEYILSKEMDSCLLGNIEYQDDTFVIMVGGSSNTIDEVNRTLKVLGYVLSNYIKGELG